MGSEGGGEAAFSPAYVLGVHLGEELEVRLVVLPVRLPRKLKLRLLQHDFGVLLNVRNSHLDEDCILALSPLDGRSRHFKVSIAGAWGETRVFENRGG